LGPAQILAWILTGLLVGMMALNLAELSSRFPEEGGIYIFGKRNLGEFVGFLVGWAYWIGLSLAIGALALATADSILLIFGAEVSIELLMLVGIFVILVLLVINILGVKLTRVAQTVLTVSKVLVLVALILYGLFFVNLENITADFAPYGYANLGIGIMIALWAYLGAEEITPPAEEAKHPEKTIPLAIVITITTAMVIYVLVSVVSIGILGYKALASYEIRGVEMAAREIWGEAGGIIFSLFMVFSFSAVINGVLLANSRILYAFSRDEIVPKKLAEIHSKYSTPWISIVAQGVVGILAILLFRVFTDIVIIVDFVMLFPYLMLSLGLLLYRTKVKDEENGPIFYIKSPITLCDNCWNNNFRSLSNI